MYSDPITLDGKHFYSPLDEYLNQRAKVKQLPDNMKDYCAVTEYYTAKAHEQTRKAQQTGIRDYILDGD